MSARAAGCVRAIALAGPSGAGKTALAQQLAAAAGPGAVTPETRGQTTETAVSGFEFMDDRFALIDTPGALEFVHDMNAALPAADLAVLVLDPDPEKAALAQPYFKAVERLRTPHMVFINRIETARGRVRDLLAALQPLSASPLVARQLPIWSDDRVSGFVDLALERAYAYQPGKPSARIAMPADITARESEARFHMLEQLADFDDALMEQLLSDAEPDLHLVFGDLVRETRDGRITPVLFGSAALGFGVRRLLKALRHDAPTPDALAGRLGFTAPGAYVLRVSHAGQAGKMTIARALGGDIPDGAELLAADGAKARVSGVFHAAGMKKTDKAAQGDIVALGKIDGARSGGALSLAGAPPDLSALAQTFAPVYQRAIAPLDRKDDVKLSAALAKVCEEDSGLAVALNPETHEMTLCGQGEAHLRVTLEKLKKRYGVAVSVAAPAVPYRETIRRPVTQRGRHKKQSGGHGQFGDVVLSVKPAARGHDFAFAETIAGGVVPKNWIPAVELGVRDAMTKGPLGFTVADVEVTLIDGSYHSVDSSEIAFRQAGRAAMSDALAAGEPYLLEPIERLTICTPNAATAKVTSAISARHGQILGFSARPDWAGWDVIEAYLPQAERQDFIVDLRAMTQGLGTLEAAFDHRVEVVGRRAEDILRKAKSAA